MVCFLLKKYINKYINKRILKSRIVYRSENNKDKWKKELNKEKESNKHKKEEKKREIDKKEEKHEKENMGLDSLDDEIMEDVRANPEVNEQDQKKWKSLRLRSCGSYVLFSSSDVIAF